MSTFKAVLRVAAAHPLYLLIYTVLVSCMGVFVANATYGTTPQASVDSYEPYSADIAVIDRDGSALSKAFVEHMDERFNSMELEDDAAVLQDALATSRVDCIMFVPEGFGRDLLAAARDGGDLPQMEEAYGSATQTSALVGAEAERWVSLAGSAAALDAASGQDVVARRVSSAVSKRADVSVHASGSVGWSASDKVALYLKFNSYAITSSIIAIVGLVLSTLSEPDLKRRLEAGPQASRSRNASALLSCLLVTLVICALSALVGLIGLFESVVALSAWQVALAFGTNVALGLVALSVAFLCSQLGAREEVLNAVGNVLGMLMSFMGGAWVPLSFMGAGVVAAAHFVPTYWTNGAVDAVLGAATPSLAALAGYGANIGIALLFAVAIGAVGLAVSGARRRV